MAIGKKRESIGQVRIQKHKDSNASEPLSAAQLISDILTGGFIKRYNFSRYFIHIVIVVLCSIIYIANTFYVQRLYRHQAILKEQIKELRAKSLTIASIKMTATRQSTIMAEIKRRGIDVQQPSTPPLVVLIPDNKDLQTPQQPKDADPAGQ